MGEAKGSSTSQNPFRLRIARKVHVIDDDESFCVLLKNMLSKLGYDVSTHNQAKVDVLHQLTEMDILIIDMIMPGVNGLQVLENLASSQIKPSVVLVSGAGDVLATAQALSDIKAIKIIGVLQKPFRSADLMKALSVGQPD